MLEKKRLEKQSQKEHMTTVNNKKLGLKEIHYRPQKSHSVAFHGYNRAVDLDFDVNHDELVWKAHKKYTFMEYDSFKNSTTLKASEGITNDKSAIKHLGEKLDKTFVLLRNSITF
jgi:hypothetical protein